MDERQKRAFSLIGPWARADCIFFKICKLDHYRGFDPGLRFSLLALRPTSNLFVPIVDGAFEPVRRWIS
jgi:hypothetical protein